MIDERVGGEDVVDDLPEVVETRMNEGFIAAELPSEQGTVFVGRARLYERRGRFVLALDRSHAAAERQSVGIIVSAEVTQDHAEPCFVGVVKRDDQTACASPSREIRSVTWSWSLRQRAQVIRFKLRSGSVVNIASVRVCQPWSGRSSTTAGHSPRPPSK